jgi:uncharacterized protein YhfF
MVPRWRQNWRNSWLPESSAPPRDWFANLVRTASRRRSSGGYVVLLDGTGRPRAIWRTTEVRIGPLNSVDERFAWDEGEGERTGDWWLSAHRRFFGRRAAVQDFQMHDEIETMFERFEVVWPPEIADGGKPLNGAIGK